MAEWSNAPVLKTGDPQGSASSNLAPSANSAALSWRPAEAAARPRRRADPVARGTGGPYDSRGHGNGGVLMRIRLASVFVSDQEHALRFYTE